MTSSSTNRYGRTRDRFTAPPPNSAVGLSIKAAMLIQMEDENGGEFEEQASYAYDGKLRLDLQALKGLAEDAARFVPELAPLVAAAVNTPAELPPVRELRALAEALVAEIRRAIARRRCGADRGRTA